MFGPTIFYFYFWEKGKEKHLMSYCDYRSFSWDQVISKLIILRY